MDRRVRRQSGIHLSERKCRNSSGHRPDGVFLLFLMRTAVVWLLSAAWWNCFFAVFPADIDQGWLYRLLLPFAAATVILAGQPRKLKLVGLISYPAVMAILFWKKPFLAAALLNNLANAYLRIHSQSSETLRLYHEPAIQGWLLSFLVALVSAPLLWAWVQILIKNRGKLSAAILMLIPLLITGWVGYFPPAQDCWFLIVCMGIYFASCGSSSGKSAAWSAAASVFCLLVLFLLSSATAKPLESIKAAEGGRYTQARSALNKNIVQRFRDIAGISKKAQEVSRKENENKPDGAYDTTDIEEKKQENQGANELKEQESPPGLEGNGTSEGFLSDRSDNLKAIEGFSPGAGDGITIPSKTRPKDTTYYTTGHGGAYTGYTWDIFPKSEVIYPDYSQYPEHISRLIELCRKQEVRTAEEASRFIQHEFEENTVYDYRPGATPDDKDFAEYFLFDNQKGFCVHFATTATLMYRIFGFQARYVQGYAVPPSAFEEQEDGTYLAEVTGEMGHAWCETYDGRWSVREHTLPYLGDESQVPAPAAASEGDGSEEHSGNTTGNAEGIGKAVLSAAIIAGILLAVISIFVVQGAVRRKKRRFLGRSYRHGKGILASYKNLYDIAVFMGMEAKEEVGTDTFEALKTALPGITPKEWDWIQMLVWSTMFDKTPPAAGEHEKLYEIAEKLGRETGRTLTLWRKIEYYYVKCLS